MIGKIFETSTVPVLEQVISFAQARQNVLAGNLANLDTPGYKARDLSVEDFQANLKTAIARRDHPHSPSSIGTAPMEKGPRMAEVAKNSQTILRHDDNFDGLEYQTTEMAKNMILHNTAITIMQKQFQQMEAAIRERL